MSEIAVNAITDASGGNTTTINGYTPTVSNMAGRNRIINGNFDIWQRGTSFSSSSVNEYSADRFRTEGYGLSTTISRQAFTAGQTDVPHFPTYFCRVVTSTIASGQFWAFQQRIEMPQVLGYGQTGTFSFWVRATTGTLPAGAFSYGMGSSRTDSPALTTAWQKITGTFTAPTSGDYGSLYLVYLGADKAAISVDIAQVQLEAGSVATPFEHRQYGQELALCQRYYEKSYNTSVAVGTATLDGAFLTTRIDSVGGGSPFFKVSKRAAPTVTVYSPTSGTAGQARNYSSSADTAASAQSIGENAFYLLAGSAGINNGLGVHYTASAEL